MNYQTINRASAAAIGLIIASVIFAFAAVGVKVLLPVPAIDADRAAERTKALAEIRAAEENSLNTSGWIDESRGIARAPIEIAIQQAAQAWQNPAAARADLIAREEKASAPVPVAPAKPSAFE
jgi:hypothetical protein